MTNPKNEPIKSVPELTPGEREKAEKEGVENAIRRSAESNFLARGETENNTAGDRWPDKSEVMRFAHLIDLGLDDFIAAIDPKANPGIPESKVAGLLGLERSGKNRTEYVRAMCKRLGVKSPTEVTNAGPGYTNDMTSLKDLGA